jgi:NADH-quinone oxidoreductase subunit N
MVTIIILTVGALVCLASSCCEEWRPTADFGTYSVLLILSALGFTLISSAGSLLMLYIALELGTVSLFALTGHHRTDQHSGEAALKYLVIGAISSAVLLYGISLVYGAYGTTYYAQIAERITQTSQLSYLAIIGLPLIIGGLAFKITAAPFHLWAPDVYEGAPTPVTAFLSTASKTAGFAALIRLLYVALPHMEKDWVMILIAVSALSMTLGNLVALSQTSLKRMLAYSGVAQAGYLLIAVVAGMKDGLGSVLFFLWLYAFANTGAFFIAQAVQASDGSDAIDTLKGLRFRAPKHAFAMLIFLLSLGGIPPLAGFWGKWFLFVAGASAGYYVLVLIGAITSVIALYYYLMVAKRIYIDPPESTTPISRRAPLVTAIIICASATIIMGLYPRPWLTWGQSATLTIPPPPSAVVKTIGK